MASVTKWVAAICHYDDVTDEANWTIVGEAFADDVQRFREEACFPSFKDALAYCVEYDDAPHIIFPVTWEE